jgi:hypothetical protein
MEVLHFWGFTFLSFFFSAFFLVGLMSLCLTLSFLIGFWVVFWLHALVVNWFFPIYSEEATLKK